MVFDWLHIGALLFLAAAAAFAAGPLAASLLLAPRAHGGALGEPYECGIPPYGGGWTRFGFNSYFYALLFLAFDVDVLYLFPAATAYSLLPGWAPFIEVALFVFVLVVAMVWFWRKGVFEWPRKIA